METIESSTDPFCRSSRRRRKHDEILRIAVELFNEQGFNATNIEQISERLGVSKRTIYNYISNKQDLVYQCYLRNLEFTQRSLEQLAAAGGTGADKIGAFICRLLNSQTGRFAVIAELDSLTPHRRRRIRKLAKGNRDQLKALLESGHRDGSIRPCNPRIISYAVFSVISWVPLWFSQAGALTLDEIGEQFSNILLHGLSADAPTKLKPIVLPTSETPPATRAFDRDQQGEVKRLALVKAATAMFNRRGIAGTSLDDIAARLKVTKGALYYYFENKAALLLACYARTLDLSEAIIEQIERTTGDPLLCIASHLHHSSLAHTGEAGPLMVFVGLDHLDPEPKRTLIRRARRLERRIEGWIQTGIEQGAVRPEVRPAMARFVIAGILDWFPKWYRADGDNTPAQITREFIELTINGLAAD